MTSISRYMVVFVLLAACGPLPPIPWPTPYPGDPTPFPIPTYTPTPVPPTATPEPTIGYPSPTPSVTPTPGGVPPSGEIIFLDDADVGKWPQTSEITGVSIYGSNVCIYHTKSGQWPMVKTAEGNPLVVTKIGGKWLAWSYEYLGKGQTCKTIDIAQWGAYSNCSACGQVKNWRPSKGEKIGLMVTTVVRAGIPHGLPSQRSNIRWLRFGQ